MIFDGIIRKFLDPSQKNPMPFVSSTDVLNIKHQSTLLLADGYQQQKARLRAGIPIFQLLQLCMGIEVGENVEFSMLGPCLEMNRVWSENIFVRKGEIF